VPRRARCDSQKSVPTPAWARIMKDMRFVALLTAVQLVGCIEAEPELTEMVVYSVPDRYGDVIVSNGMIRWTDGVSAYEAQLAAMPIDGRYTEPLADTNRHITVHGDTLYVVDPTGVLSFTGGTKARVVTQLAVERVMVTDDTLYWTHDTGFSWFGSGGQQQSVYTEAGVIELVTAGGALYATTIGTYSVPPLGSLVTRSKLFRIDPVAKTATEVADGADFIDDFIDDGHFGAGDIYQTGGLYAIDNQLYWSVYLNTQSFEYSQRLVERVTASGFELALAPQPQSSEIMLDAGSFYWNADNTLWRATPDEAPERLFVDDLHVIAVADGYAYGFVPAISGVGYDLRRISVSAVSRTR
jgi:hypothetical protein